MPAGRLIPLSGTELASVSRDIGLTWQYLYPWVNSYLPDFRHSGGLLDPGHALGFNTLYFRVD